MDGWWDLEMAVEGYKLDQNLEAIWLTRPLEKLSSIKNRH